MVIPAPVLHQHLEVHQPPALLAQPRQLVDARPLEGEPPAVEALVVGGAHGRAGPVARGVTAADASLHPALLPGAALGSAAHGPAGRRLADAPFGAGGVPPELLAQAVEAALEEAAALASGDAPVGVEGEALLALAGLHAGRGGAVGRGGGVVAGGGAGGAAGGVVAVLRAGESCGRGGTPRSRGAGHHGHGGIETSWLWG